MSTDAASQNSVLGLELQAGSRIALALLGGAFIYLVTDPASKAILSKLAQDQVLRQRVAHVGQAVFGLLKPLG